MSNVISPFQLKPERIAELRDQGVEVIGNFGELDIPEPSYGENIVGELTDEETALFLALRKAAEDYEAVTREASARFFERLGRTIRDKMEIDPKKALSFETIEEERDAARKNLLVDALRSNLYFQIAERLGIHEFNIGVRSKKRIVTTTHRLRPE